MKITVVLCDSCGGETRLGVDGVIQYDGEDDVYLCDACAGVERCDACNTVLTTTGICPVCYDDSFEYPEIQKE